MTDKELLELAAKAAEMEHMKWTGISLAKKYDPSKPDHKTGCIGPDWNPLTDDGDALRLAVKLGFKVNVLTTRMEPFTRVRQHEIGTIFEEEHRDDAAKATRRAIVRAAAEIGKNVS